MQNNAPKWTKNELSLIYIYVSLKNQFITKSSNEANWRFSPSMQLHLFSNLEYFVFEKSRSDLFASFASRLKILNDLSHCGCNVSLHVIKFQFRTSSRRKFVTISRSNQIKTPFFRVSCARKD